MSWGRSERPLSTRAVAGRHHQRRAPEAHAHRLVNEHHAHQISSRGCLGPACLAASCFDLGACIRHYAGTIVNHMVQYSGGQLDASFGALSDATRRGVLEQLGRGDASITDLAGRFHMSLTGMRKHVGVLELAGLVTTEKVGRVRICKLGLGGLEEEAAWIERYRQLWDARFDELDKVVEEMKQKEKVDGRRNRE